MELITWEEYKQLSINEKIAYDYWLYVIDSPISYKDS